MAPKRCEQINNYSNTNVTLIEYQDIEVLGEGRWLCKQEN